MATNSIEFDSERPTDRRSSMLNIQPEVDYDYVISTATFLNLQNSL